MSQHGDDLPPDVLREIFFSLDLKQIHKFRCVSKLWNSLLSNPSLVQKVFKRITVSPPWTMVYVYNLIDIYSPHVIQTHSLDIHHNFINDHNDCSFQFLLDDTHSHRVYLTASSVNGLVLYQKEDSETFSICNPLTKQCVSLPPPPFRTPGNYSSASLVSETSTSSNFKVVFSEYSSSRFKSTLHVFSSDTGEWRTDEVHSRENIFSFYLSNIVIHNGVMYWTDECRCRDKEGYKMVIRAFNLDNKKFPRNSALPTISLPKDIKQSNPSPRDGFFGVSEGSIYYGHVYHTRRNEMGFLSVWLLEDYCNNGGWVWQLVHKNINMGDHIPCSAVSFKFIPEDRNVIIFSKECLTFAFNIGTRTCEVLRRSPIPSLRYDVMPSPLLVTPKPTRISYRHSKAS